MKLIVTYTLLFLTMLTSVVNAATKPPRTISPATTLQLTNLKADFKVVLKNTSDRNPTLKERIITKLLERKWLKRWLSADNPLTEKQKRQANLSLILGIGSLLLLLFASYGFSIVGLFAIPAGIIGIILGVKSLKGNTNTKGLVGIIASTVTLLIFIIFLVVIATAFANFP
ncbi:MAG: hypothetical protein ICV81_16965 [Flavisolibacter sp.]|nr:hypothetical protein [Flavisolibacter sp.]